MKLLVIAAFIFAVGAFTVSRASVLRDEESLAPVDTTSKTLQPGSENMFASFAQSLQGRQRSDLLNFLAQHDTKPADSGTARPEHVTLPNQNVWSPDTNSMPLGTNGDMLDTFDFLIKSLSSANNYVSMLTREQLSVLRAIRPGLLYEFLQEVAKVRNDKRNRRIFSSECAFCKNNGVNEEYYTSHSLKDWRGRVLCPVLRAFRCPRCGATGDWAHTLKYCPETPDGGSDRDGGYASRRRVPTSASSQANPCAGTEPLAHSNFWSYFGMK